MVEVTSGQTRDRRGRSGDYFNEKILIMATLKGATLEDASGHSAEGVPARFRGLNVFRAGDYVCVTGKVGLGYAVGSIETDITVSMGRPLGFLFWSPSVPGSTIRGWYLGWRLCKTKYTDHRSRLHFILPDVNQCDVFSEAMRESLSVGSDVLVVVDEKNSCWPREDQSFNVEFTIISEGRCFI